MVSLSKEQYIYQSEEEEDEPEGEEEYHQFRQVEEKQSGKKMSVE